MPLEQAVWRIDNSLRRLQSIVLSRELDLERFIEEDVTILSSNWMIIGRQVASDVGPIDLLALDSSGALVVVELKRQQTTRDITAQALDYASWVENLTADQIVVIYTNYCERYRPQDSRITLDEAFRKRFHIELPVEQLNETHQIVLVASELDARTERIVRYLAGRGINMNILFFQVFADGDHRFLSRVWMLDQGEIEEQQSHARSQAIAEWNGEYYASFGLWDGERRTWEDAIKYGFISAGGGRWYSNTLQLLAPGSRVWVNVPGKGYVGVGEATGVVQRASEFTVADDKGKRVSILQVSNTKDVLIATANDPDLAEYFVPIKWIKTVSLRSAIKEVGLFGNQHSVCQPLTPKWLHTVSRLKQLFDIT